jgi:ABC-type molybdate transport system substrate-binding protein
MMSAEAKLKELAIKLPPTIGAAAIALAMMLAPAFAKSAEVTFLCSNALKAVMQEMTPQFEKTTGKAQYLLGRLFGFLRLLH